MKNITTVRKLVSNKENINGIYWTDHAYSAYIKKFGLVLKIHENCTAYWTDKENTKELVFLYDDMSCKKKVFLATQ
tara:strand:- start:86 stop:313 length:228 start_codon:yes stop_codon:yes gene_type:complete